MTPLDVALERISEIEAELAELRTFVRVYYRMFPQEKLAAKQPETLKGFARNYRANIFAAPVDNSVDNSGLGISDSDIGEDQREGKGAARSKLRKAREIFRDVFEKHIRAAGKPLTRSELLTLIESDQMAPDLPIGTAEDQAKYLGTLLWRNRSDFRNLPGFGYWLKREPYPLANYDPANDTEGAALLDSEVGFAEKPTLTKEIRQRYSHIKKKIAAYELDKIVDGLDEAASVELGNLIDQKLLLEHTFTELTNDVFA